MSEASQPQPIPLRRDSSTSSISSLSSISSSFSVMNATVSNPPPADVPKIPCTFGILLDIDGVLLTDGRVIPGAIEALDALCSMSSQIRPCGMGPVPFVLVSNGGGASEEETAVELTDTLGVPVEGSQLILSTTPMKALVPVYQHSHILVVGRAEAPELAKLYGFTKVETVEQFAIAHPYLFPQKDYHRAYLTTMATTRETPIEAILVIQAPSEWGEAMQIICDIVRGEGRVSLDGQPLSTVDVESTSKPQIPIFIANPDVVYAGQYHTPRFTVGAFVMCLQMMYKYVTGKDLECTMYGKPSTATYRCAESALQYQAFQLGQQEISTIYAIGDNPLSDQASQTSNAEWFTILTKTGCFRGPDNDPHYPAKAVVDNVYDAIRVVMERETEKINKGVKPPENQIK